MSSFARVNREFHEPALWHAAERTSVFAEVDPNQKERIILALKKMGHVVGFLVRRAPRSVPRDAAYVSNRMVRRIAAHRVDGGAGHAHAPPVLQKPPWDRTLGDEVQKAWFYRRAK